VLDALNCVCLIFPLQLTLSTSWDWPITWGWTRLKQFCSELDLEIDRFDRFVLKLSRVAKTDPSRVGRSSRLLNSEVTSANKTRLSPLLTTKIKNCSGEFRTISGETKLAALTTYSCSSTVDPEPKVEASSHLRILDEFEDEAANMIATHCFS